MVWIPSLLFALIFLVLSAPCYHDAAFFRPRNSYPDITTQTRERILLLTAHPDDECMFFAPTLLALTRNILKVRNSGGSEDQASGSKPVVEVYSLCLSSGDADGLGETRKRELEGSLDVLGVKQGMRWVLDNVFHDNITLFWDAGLIAEQVKPFIEDHNVNIILTFDDRGISSHPNHVSLERGVRALLADSQRKDLRAFNLKTTPLLPKYAGAGAALFARLEEAFCTALPSLPFLDNFPMQSLPPFLEVLRITDCARYGEGEERSKRALFVSGWSEYTTALRAMKQHRSQLVWFRWLYVMFSRYMWVNEWEEIAVDSA